MSKFHLFWFTIFFFPCIIIITAFSDDKSNLPHELRKFTAYFYQRELELFDYLPIMYHANTRFRLLPTFASVLREKIRRHASFTKILANYNSEESLITAVYDKNII